MMLKTLFMLQMNTCAYSCIICAHTHSLSLQVADIIHVADDLVGGHSRQAIEILKRYTLVCVCLHLSSSHATL